MLTKITKIDGYVTAVVTVTIIAMAGIASILAAVKYDL